VEEQQAPQRGRQPLSVMRDSDFKLQEAQYLRRLADRVPSMLAYWDRNLICRFANRAYERWFGVDPESLIGTSIRDLLGPELFALNEPHIAGVLRGEEQTFERVVPGPGGVRRRGLAHYQPDVVDGVVVGFFVQVTETTKLKEAETEALRQAATVRSMADVIPANVAVFGLDYRYRFINSAFERWSGLPRDRIIGGTLREVLGEDEFERRRPYAQRAFAGEVVTFQLDYSNPGDTTYLSITYIPLRLDTGEIDGLVVVAQDITQQTRKEISLKQLSQRDPLTGLLNRAGFERFLQKQVQAGGGEALAMLYIDLDCFKPINDQHGHAVGDRVLQLFAQRLANVVRATDAVGRLGGDEFAVALSGVSEQAVALAVAEKAVTAARMPYEIGELLLKVDASVGVAFGVDPAKGWNDLVERSDARMLAAKAAGKAGRSTETR